MEIEGIQCVTTINYVVNIHSYNNCSKIYKFSGNMHKENSTKQRSYKVGMGRPTLSHRSLQGPGHQLVQLLDNQFRH